MRVKLAELNWLKLTLPNPTYKAHCFPQLDIHKCACVRYWPDRGLVFECVTCFYRFLFISSIGGEIMLSERRIYDYPGVRIRLSLKQLKYIEISRRQNITDISRRQIKNIQRSFTPGGGGGTLDILGWGGAARPLIP